MNIVFRVDASLQIGNGHVMRCLVLADVLRTAGAHCHFICREHPGNLIAQIRQHGFEVSVLPAPADAFISDELAFDSHPNYEVCAWLGADWVNDAIQTKILVGRDMIDWLIIDHYSLDSRWEKALCPICLNIMVIDDLANRAHHCDLLLDQNLGRSMEDYTHLVPENCALLIGPKYALLRPEFGAMRDFSLLRRVSAQLKHLLITMGGVDQVDATSKVLEALLNCTLPSDLRITVVMGQQAPWLERVQLLVKKMPLPTELKVNVNNMAQLMADSDLAIGAAGSTSWERCCLGLPSIICVQAANQRLIASALKLSGASESLSISADLQPSLEVILNVFRKKNNLQKMSASAAKIVDGKGVSRVAAQLKARASP